MTSEIRVYVASYGRKFLYMRYTDPMTGERIAKSTGKADPKEAAKVAAKWEAELQEGRYKPRSKVSWDEFRQRYEDEAMGALKATTRRLVRSLKNL